MPANRRSRAAVWLGVIAIVPIVASASSAAEPALTRVSHESPVDQAPATCSPAAEPAHQHDYEFQPHLALDPLDASHAAVGWIQDFGDAVVVGITRDGGKTWEEAVPGWDPEGGASGFMACANGPAGLSSATNPHVAIDKNGTVYAVADLKSASSTGAAAVVVSSSPDGGTHWTPALTLASSTAADTYAIGWSGIAVDPHRRGTAYAVWDVATGNDAGAQALSFTAMTEYVARTTDGGTTWSSPTAIGTPETGALLGSSDVSALTGQRRMWNGSTLAVLPNGAVLDVFEDCPNSFELGCGADSSVRVVRSDDGGAHWGTPVDVTAPGDLNRVVDVATSPDGSAVYVAWYAGYLSGAPHLARSLDGGRTFEDAAVDLPQNGDPEVVSTENVAVSSDGSVALLYFRPDADGRSSSVWLARSTDRGDSFTHTRIAGPYDTSAIDAQPGRGVGEYQGLRGGPSGFSVAVTTVSTDPDNPTDIAFARF